MTQDQILHGARSLFMRYGIKSVTMDDVARELGISKKTLYQHVENKSDLIRRIIDAFIDNEKKCLEDIRVEAVDPIQQIVLTARFVLKKLREVRPTAMFDLKKYYRETWQKMDAFHIEYVREMIRKNIDDGISQGYYRENLDADIISKLYVGKTMLVTDEEMFPIREYDRNRLFKELITYHLRGIVSEKGLERLKTLEPEIE